MLDRRQIPSRRDERDQAGQKHLERDCTASVGLCRLHGDVPDAETCFRAVDRAMYRAKGQGRDRVVVGSISERRG